MLAPTPAHSLWPHLRPLLLALIGLCLMFLAAPGRAQGYKTLESYRSGEGWYVETFYYYDGFYEYSYNETIYYALSGSGYPSAGVTLDSAGNRYTVTGDDYGYGFVSEVTATGGGSTPHTFGTGTVSYIGGGSGEDGQNPLSPVIFDSQGDMYGTASGGGTNGNGVVWEIPYGGTYEIIHAFGGTVTNADGLSGHDGIRPEGSLAIDASGNLYGSTAYGGSTQTVSSSGDGMVWEITSSGSYLDLYEFGASGTAPSGGVTLDSTGNLYGTASAGGAYSLGVLWEIPAGGSYTELHQFGGGTDGANPAAAPAIDSKGNLFGTATSGGSNADGVLWEIPNSSSYQVLYNFGGSALNASGQTVQDGYNPVCQVSFDAAGNIYGTTEEGGANDGGTVWELTAFGTYVHLHDFGPYQSDGESPLAGVTLDPNGNLYGTTSTGGSEGFYSAGSGGGLEYNPTGTIWEQSGVNGLTVSPYSVTGAGTTTGTVTIPFAAPSGGLPVALSSSNPTYIGVPTSVTIPVGQTSTTFNVTTKDYDGSYEGFITANDGYVLQQARIVVQPLIISSLTILPSPVAYGNSGTGTVTINNPAPNGGWTVNLSSSTSYVSLPASVTIPAGSTSTTFTVTPANYYKNYTAAIKANDGVSTLSAPMSVSCTYLSSVSASPNPVTAGGSCTGTVTISQPAPSGGWTVNLSSSTSHVTVPSSVVVPAGTTSTTFAIATTNYYENYTPEIKATDSVSSTSTTFTVDSISLSSVSATPNPVSAGGSCTGTVTITQPAPSGGWTVNLSSSTSYVTVPSSVVIPEGTTSTTFTISAADYYANYTANIKAADGVSSKSTALTVDAITIASVSLSPSEVANGTSSQGTVTLSGAAPASGLTVQLTSSNPGHASVPATITFAPGATQGSFTVTTGLAEVKFIASITITATISGPGKSTTLTLTP